ncbi:hypothetical protein LY78DRAFT_554653, partial [Colletotrichum sublineola]
DILSYTFRGRTLGQIINGKRTRLTWRPSDLGLMKGFLAHYRLCQHELRAMSELSGSRARPYNEGGPLPPFSVQPDLFVLARHMNVDTAILSDAAWGAIRAKMVSSMEYTIEKNVR